MSWQPREHDSEWPFDLFATDFDLDHAATALLVVDMQGSDPQIDPDSELGQKYPQIVTYWNERMKGVVVPNIVRLLDTFRTAGRRVIYTRNGRITPHGDELTARLRRHEPKAERYRGTPAYDIMPRSRSTRRRTHRRQADLRRLQFIDPRSFAPQHGHWRCRHCRDRH